MNTQDILVYVPTGVGKPKILTVESSSYLPSIRKKLPNADIFAVAAEIDDTAPYERLGVTYRELDYRLNLPDFSPAEFDIIIAEDCLTHAFTPYDTILGLGRLLNGTGFLVTDFLNARYHEVLDGLKNGLFTSRERRFFTKQEIVKLFNDAVFKEIDFTFAVRDDADVNKWERMGFDNFNHDLRTKRWIVKAAKSKAAVSALKSLYTTELRTELARILHRIEYDVNRADNLPKLWALIEKDMIFPEYLKDFVVESCVRHSEMFTVLKESAADNGLTDFAEIFSS